ncbi:hypothetical protein GH714_015753 [Hevea brasiliensis]|uniref:Uncharacterized protein n=1 Tax=Hevea brasiliensis TaxID=3981 RepID=A0A6A6NHJ2_HEVBR|nr:hypothetical protein GH714_015753 [Hevea brasiliensis]
MKEKIIQGVEKGKSKEDGNQYVTTSEALVAGLKPQHGMNCISWNCQGFGQPLAVRALIELKRKYSPSMIFIMETKNKQRILESARKRLGFDKSHYVDLVDDKLDGSQVRPSHVNDFRDFISFCELMVLQFKSLKFTRFNKHFSQSTIPERLDRALASIEW